jgi:uroporphyrin-III C-methyltransferase
MANSDSRTPSPRGNSRSALIIVGVLALLGLAYSIARVDILRARITELRISLEAFQQNDASLRAQLAALDINQQRATTQLTQLQAGLASLHDNVGDLRGRAEQIQRLSVVSEARYLLRLANQQLQLGHDVAGALETLTAAAAVLSNPADNAIEAVHQQVVVDMMQLRALPGLDLAAITQQLNAADLAVNQLQLLGIMPPQSVSSGEALPAAGVTRAWALFKQGLGKLLTIKDSGAAATALLSNDEQALRRRHLQVLLLSARVALPLHDQHGYVMALNAARQWLGQCFDQQDAQVQQLGEQLQLLAQQNIAPAMPDLSASIEALNHQLTTASEASP